MPDLAVVRPRRRASRSTRPTRRSRTSSRASVGTNLGRRLPAGLARLRRRRGPPDADLAERIIWLDALTANVDRTWSNPNLLVWHGRTWAIDHGAALYFHHSWPEQGTRPGALRRPALRREPPRAARRRRRRGAPPRRARRAADPRRAARPSSPTCPTSGSSRPPSSRTSLRCVTAYAADAAGAAGPAAHLGAGRGRGVKRVPVRPAAARAPRRPRGVHQRRRRALLARTPGILDAAWELDAARASALSPACDLDGVRAMLERVRAVCRGETGRGLPTLDKPGQRFGWIIAPRSTVVQPGPVHGGLCEDPATELERLMERLVRD